MEEATCTKRSAKTLAKLAANTRLWTATWRGTSRAGPPWPSTPRLRRALQWEDAGWRGAHCRLSKHVSTLSGRTLTRFGTVELDAEFVQTSQDGDFVLALNAGLRQSRHTPFRVRRDKASWKLSHLKGRRHPSNFLLVRQFIMVTEDYPINFVTSHICLI